VMLNCEHGQLCLFTLFTNRPTKSQRYPLSLSVPDVLPLR